MTESLQTDVKSESKTKRKSGMALRRVLRKIKREIERYDYVYVNLVRKARDAFAAIKYLLFCDCSLRWFSLPQRAVIFSLSFDVGTSWSTGVVAGLVICPCIFEVSDCKQ